MIPPNETRTRNMARDTEAGHRVVRMAIVKLRTTVKEGELLALLVEVRVQLTAHFESEEQPATGLFATILEHAPRHANAIEQLNREHMAMLQTASQLLKVLIDAPRPACTAHRQCATELAEALETHERREQGLLQDTLERDIQGGN